jgi:demethylmenaquinone methyltransferase/2-methoxy-6-polyprenyl-1,4-benzoquinol methylase
MERKIARVTRSKGKARLFYNHISRIYDFSEGVFERKYIQMGVKKLSVESGDIVLEIGVGTGESVLEFAKLVGDSGKVYGVDISEGMLNVTQGKLREMNLLHRITLICKDAVFLPFNEGFFDAVFMSFTLELFDTPEIPKIVSECYRVLKKGGRIGIVSLSKKIDTGMSRMYEWFHGLFPKMLDCRPIFVEDALNDAGFTVQDTSLIFMWGLPVEIIVGKKS